jgi:hypothetical protein
MGIDRDQALMLRRVMKGKRAPEDVPATTGSTKMILELERRGVDLATRSMLRAVTKDLASLQALTDTNHIFELVAGDQLERIQPLLAPRMEYARCDLELPERKASTSRSHAVSGDSERKSGCGPAEEVVTFTQSTPKIVEGTATQEEILCAGQTVQMVNRARVLDLMRALWLHLLAYFRMLCTPHTKARADRRCRRRPLPRKLCGPLIPIAFQGAHARNVDDGHPQFDVVCVQPQASPDLDLGLHCRKPAGDHCDGCCLEGETLDSADEVTEGHLGRVAQGSRASAGDGS